MSKFSLKAATGFILVMAAIVCLTSAPHAEARPQYLPIWVQTYPSVAEKNDIKTVKCNVCHVGPKKVNRNDYGKAIVKALMGKKNIPAKKKADFIEVLKAAEKEKNADGKTFGDLLKADELPSK